MGDPGDGSWAPFEGSRVAAAQAAPVAPIWHLAAPATGRAPAAPAAAANACPPLAPDAVTCLLLTLSMSDGWVCRMIV